MDLNQNCKENNRSFSNRMDKCRSLNKLKKSLPVDPVKREVVLKAYIESSPAMTSCKKKLVKHSEFQTAEKVL